MDDGTRTRDDRHHKPGLYQLSYTHRCTFCFLQCADGAPGRTRTCNIRIRNPVLYPVELRAHSKRPFCQTGKSAGRGREIRTPDPLLPKQMRYQAAPCPDARFSATQAQHKPESARGAIIRPHRSPIKHLSPTWSHQSRSGILPTSPHRNSRIFNEKNGSDSSFGPCSQHRLRRRQGSCPSAHRSGDD